MFARAKGIADRLRRPLKEARAVILPALLLVALLLLVLVFRSEPAVRFSGLFLQVVGLSLVLWQLDRTGVLFGQPTLRGSLVSWANRVRGAFREPRNASATIELGTIVSTARIGTPTITLSGKRTLATRVVALEQTAQELRLRIDERHGELARQLKELSHRVTAEASRLAVAQQELQATVADHAVGDLTLARSGVILTLLGVLAATASPELARFLPSALG